MTKQVYLDNNATTTVDKKVVEEMMRDFGNIPLNPSSLHPYGQKAKTFLLKAKEKIANYFSCEIDDIIFTSGGTESLNTAIFGLLKNIPSVHIISTDIEHACVHNTLFHLSKNNYDVTFLPSNTSGTVEITEIEKHIKEKTRLLVFSWVNTETGVINDIEKIAQLASRYNIDLVVDGVAALGKENIFLYEGLSALCFSAHKIHGPKGIGLIILKKNSFQPYLYGGTQENNRRPGTENLAGILGFSKAIELLEKNDVDKNNIIELRDLFEQRLKETLGDIIHVNGEGKRTCNTTNICFDGVNSESLLIQLNLSGVYASFGSACSSGFSSPSRILTNMGYDKDRVNSSLRFSLSRYTSREDILFACTQIIACVNKLRPL